MMQSPSWAWNSFEVQVPRTIVGLGAVKRLGELTRGMGTANALVVTDRGVTGAGLLDSVTGSLSESDSRFTLFEGCEPNAPLDVIEHCAALIHQQGCDVVIGVGGGSVMDTAKLSSLRAGTGQDVREFVGVNRIGPQSKTIPKILVPTTSGSGSEWSRNAVFLDRSTGVKNSMSSPHLMAQAVVIDPELTAALPAHVTADTGVDALSHAIEAYTTIKSTIISDMFAAQTIGLVAANLPGAHASGGQNMQARYAMALAASLGIAAAMSTGGGGVLAHGMAYPLRDMAPLPVSHGASVSVLMPHIMRFQLPSNLSRFARIATLMGERVDSLPLYEAALKSADAVKRLSAQLGMPQRLRDFGITKEDIPRLVESMFELRAVHANTSCRPASPDEVAHIYEEAW